MAVSDEHMAQAQRSPASRQRGRRLSRGAATVAALQNLCQQGWIQAHERVVLFNTGSGLKYASSCMPPPTGMGQAFDRLDEREHYDTDGSCAISAQSYRSPPYRGVRTALFNWLLLGGGVCAAPGGYRSHTLD